MVATLSPELGRWLSRDPIGERANDRNLFAAMHNAPTYYVDFLGEYATSPQTELTKTGVATELEAVTMGDDGMYWFQAYPGGLYSVDKLVSIKMFVAVDSSLTSTMSGAPRPRGLGADPRQPNFIGVWMKLVVTIEDQYKLNCFCGNPQVRFDVGWTQSKHSVPPAPPLTNENDNDANNHWYQSGHDLSDTPGQQIVSAEASPIPSRMFKDTLRCRKNNRDGLDPANRVIGTFSWGMRYTYDNVRSDGSRLYTSTLSYDDYFTSATAGVLLP